MIRKIGVENFRVFKDYTEFELRPITILTGPNNSGKSSFTKLLLLLKNGIETLDFKSGEHNLGDFNKVLNWENTTKEFRIRLFNLLPELPSEWVYDFYYNEAAYPYKKIISKQECDLLRLEQEDKILMDYNPFGDDGISLKEEYIKGNFTFNITELIDLIFNKNFMLYGQPANSKSYDHYGFKELSSLNHEKWEEYKEIAEDVKNNNNILIQHKKLKFLSELEFLKLKEFILKFGGNKLETNTNPFYINANVSHKINGIIITNKINNIAEGKKLLFHANVVSGRSNIGEKYDKFLWEQQKEIFSDSNLLRSNNLANVFNSIRNFYRSNKSLELLKTKIESDLKNNNTIILDYKVEVYPSKLSDFIFKEPFYKSKGRSFWDFLTSSLESLNYVFSNTQYIKANRGTHERVYNNRAITQINEIVSDFSSKTLSKGETEYLDEVSNIFDLPGKILVERIENVFSIVYLENNKRKINLADVGFGYSQLVPIILEIMNKFEDDFDKGVISFDSPTIIIEEPEANLHPKMQSKFADFLMLTRKYYPELCLVIETHSEYLIRKLQYLTAKKEIQTKDLIIYYFNDDKYVTAKEPKVKPIEITETGGLTDTFGPGFFDETTRLQFELAKLNKSQNK